MQAIRDSDLGSYSRLHRVAHIDNGRAARRLHVTDIGHAVVDGNLTAAPAIEPGEVINPRANRRGLPFEPPPDFQFFRWLPQDLADFLGTACTSYRIRLHPRSRYLFGVC